MNLLEEFFVPLEEKRIAGKILWSEKLGSLSVNNSYSFSEAGETYRTFTSLQIQSSIATIAKYQRTKESSHKTPVLLSITFNQIVDKNQDWTPNRVSVIDVDNPLKHTIDALTNGWILKDDNLVCWIIAKRVLNQKEYSSFDLKIFDYNARDFFEQRNKIWDKYKMEFSWRVNIPTTLKIPSFNDSYDIISTWFKKDKNWFDKEYFKKILKPEVKVYKEYIWKEIKQQLELNYPWFKLLKGKDLIIWLRFWIKNVEKRDLDNMFKSNIDSLTKIIYFDDKWIDTIIASKESVASKDAEFIEFTVYSKN